MKNEDSIHWEIDVPIFRNPLIVKQLGLAIGIPFGILLIFLLFLSLSDPNALYGVALVVLLLLLTFLFVKVIYKGVYQAAFVLDNRAVTCKTRSAQGKTNRIVNGLTFILGIFSAKPAVAGAGILAQSRQSVSLRWRNVKKVKYLPKQHAILLRGGYLESIAVFCREDNYQEVSAWISKHSG
ncbi:MAG: hypothetical protein CVU86_08215 [Firmicutes bacterium HGW-Firmicutes-11]|jgi:hypothetical protein|nr:MAG: hypothetical protein CVU86_08215 [Firmicutes bacterium HGW-Firmicutes-11]